MTEAYSARLLFKCVEDLKAIQALNLFSCNEKKTEVMTFAGITLTPLLIFVPWPRQHFESVIHTFVTVLLDYWNELCLRAGASSVAPLQLVQMLLHVFEPAHTIMSMFLPF